MNFRRAIRDDLEGINEIYNEAVVNSTASFHLQPQSLDYRREWFDHHDDRFAVYVAEDEGVVEGWSSLSRWSDRPAYNATAESSVYIRERSQRMGLGRQLQTVIMEHASECQFHTLIAQISAENDGSIRMHKQFGFELIGTMKEAGFKFGRWIDVVMMQVMLKE